MKLKRSSLCAAMVCLLTSSLPAQSQLKLSCNMDWPAFSSLEVVPPDKMIGVMKASEWTKAHVDQMLSVEEECSRSGPDVETLRKARWEDVRDHLYPRALLGIEARDKKILREQAAALKAQEQAAAMANPPSRPEPQAQVQPQPTYQPVETRGPQAAPPQDIQPQSGNSNPEPQRGLLYVLLTVAGAIGLWGWNRFIRNRCPNCKETTFEKTGETEVDRWRATKAVSERNSRGTNTRHVQTTFVNIQFAYKCNHCHHEWMKQRKEELGSASQISRFFAGY